MEMAKLEIEYDTVRALTARYVVAETNQTRNERLKAYS